MSKRTARAELRRAAPVFGALGDPTRLALVERLSAGGPASVSALARGFPLMTRQGVSKHIKVLAAAGIVDGRRSGRERLWVVNPSRLADGRQCLELIAEGWNAALARLRQHVENT